MSMDSVEQGSFGSSARARAQRGNAMCRNARALSVSILLMFIILGPNRSMSVHTLTQIFELTTSATMQNDLGKTAIFSGEQQYANAA
jgi:hypothetical protein